MATRKLVNGEYVDLTAEGIAEIEASRSNVVEETFNAAMTQLRNKRNDLLKDSDWTQANDSPLTDAKKTEWQTYRTSLRNITSGLTTHDEVDSVTWPTKPE